MAHDKRQTPDDTDCRSPPESSPEASDPRSASSRSKASIRVSLACVQCRSKHVKCDATQPACGRCQAEGKPCYYTKSRRGIRDPKKRSLISDKPPMSSLQHTNPATEPAPLSLPFNISDTLPNGWVAPRPTDTNESLVGVFFNHFYLGHPILPPKRYFLKYVESDPNSYHFLLSVIDFCGALYLGHPRLNDLREVAYSAACGPLPFTVQSVQGLHILAIIAFGEGKFPHHTGFSNRSWTMAIELGMHRKSFADRTLDAVWAESCRRTWWYIKFQSTIRCASEVEPSVDIYDVESDADIPCSEEWEYQSGNVPLPMSLLQYKRELNLGRSDFPSLAFQIEMCRIQADIRDLCDGVDGEDVDRTEMINQADSKISDFLRRVPRWKMDVVDPAGRPDQVLFGALAWAHISRIRLRQSSLRAGLNLREYFPFGPDRGPERKGQAVKQFGWNLQSVEIQAANSLCDLFRYPFPIASLRPMMVPGLLRVAIVYLDACVFLGLDSPVFRERINALIRILTIHGETWPLSKRIAEDIQAVADEYLTPRSQPRTSPSEWDTMVTGAISNTSFIEPSVGGFDPYLFADSQLECVLLDYHESEQVMPPIVSTW
ncbi:putative C6 transcription factor [Rosellinia necatrix]|uniref:Putative C6 transcription factor n=1 Tax=Rosellinia necatrix TaxID=77044 RepID=A0A1S7UM24_ROSNE|nr:putative C6 transcription factor [Rosellinia necatrix]